MTRQPLAAELSQMPPGDVRARAVHALYMRMSKGRVAELTGLSLGQVSSDVKRAWRMGLPRKGRGTRAEAAGEGLTFEERDGGATAESTSARITTLEQLLAACAVDLTRWQVDRYVVNKWEVGANLDGAIVIEPLFQVKAWLSPRVGAPVEQALDSVIERLAARAPLMGKARAHLDCGEYLMVPNLYDVHLNKRSADGQYTLERAAGDFKAVADAIAERARTLPMPVERILFPVGNDALHADNLAGDTTDGTRLETVADQRDAIDALIDAVGYAVWRLVELAPVDVVAIESNHDRLNTFWLGKVLSALFCRTLGVTVDATRAPNKYYTYGSTLIGLQHGDKIKPDALAVLMAVEAPDAWAKTRYRQWLRGHIHYAASMHYVATETHGVSVRVIPALCPPDQYHLLRGYVGGHQAAETLYYHRLYGPAGMFPVYVDELERSNEGRVELAEAA